MTRQPGLIKERRRIHHQRPPRRTRRVTFCGFGSFLEFSPCVACCRFVEEDWQLAWVARKRKEVEEGDARQPALSRACIAARRRGTAGVVAYGTPADGALSDDLDGRTNDGG